MGLGFGLISFLGLVMLLDFVVGMGFCSSGGLVGWLDCRLVWGWLAVA